MLFPQQILFYYNNKIILYFKASLFKNIKKSYFLNKNFLSYIYLHVDSNVVICKTTQNITINKMQLTKMHDF